MNVGSCDRLAKPSENLGKIHGELSNAYQKPLISGRDVFKHQCMCQQSNILLIISLQTYKERKLEGHSVLDDPMSSRDLVVYRGEKQQQ